MDQLVHQLECPICKQYMKPPILLCETGHSICGTCRPKYPVCPICSRSLTNCKNIALESLASSAKCFSCINSKFACKAKLTLIEKDTHESVCKMDTIRCPIEKCKWTGRIAALRDHWNSKNFTLKPYKSDNVCHTKLSESRSYYTNLIEAYDKMFVFKCMSDDGEFFWAVQYVGGVNETENYFYEIEVFKPGRWNNKFILSNYCQSICVKNEDLFVPSVCTFTPIKLLEPYINDGALVYYLRVKRVEQSNVNEIVTQFIKLRTKDHSNGQKGRHSQTHQRKDREEKIISPKKVT